MDLIDRDVAILICSRGREPILTRLLEDLDRAYLPALAAAGLTSCVWVYAQGYSPDYLGHLEREFGRAVAAGELVILPAQTPHRRIGEVVRTAIQAVHDRGRYTLAMLMDDDSVYAHDEEVARNLQAAARRFIAERHRAYSIKLGTGTSLAYEPFIDFASPIMPFKEKMLWVSRAVLEEVLRLPRFAELSIGEDAVIAALAWLPDPDACLAVYGIASFLHLGFEPSEEFAGVDLQGGGYAELMAFAAGAADGPQTKYDEALRTGVTPHHVLPDIFVPEDHPHYVYNGVRAETALRVQQLSGSAR